jgi:hypothetical protein
MILSSEGSVTVSSPQGQDELRPDAAPAERMLE